MTIQLPDWRTVLAAAVVGAAIAIVTDIDAYFESKRINPTAVYSPRLAILRAIRGAAAGILMITPGLGALAAPADSPKGLQP